MTCRLSQAPWGTPGRRRLARPLSDQPLSHPRPHLRPSCPHRLDPSLPCGTYTRLYGMAAPAGCTSTSSLRAGPIPALMGRSWSALGSTSWRVSFYASTTLYTRCPHTGSPTFSLFLRHFLPRTHFYLPGETLVQGVFYTQMSVSSTCAVFCGLSAPPFPTTPAARIAHLSTAAAAFRDFERLNTALKLL